MSLLNVSTVETDHSCSYSVFEYSELIDLTCRTCSSRQVIALVVMHVQVENQSSSCCGGYSLYCEHIPMDQRLSKRR